MLLASKSMPKIVVEAQAKVSQSSKDYRVTPFQKSEAVGSMTFSVV